VPKHEHWTRVIVQQELSKELREHDVDPLRVCALIKNRDGDPDVTTFHRQIISSQLDVDRMDYLCRDAHFAGVPLGRIDLQYLIRNVCVVEHGSQKTLGLMSKGVASYEAFAFARHIMNRSVYFHKQVATFECMMEECLRLLACGGRVGFEPELIAALRKAKDGIRPAETSWRDSPARVGG
jgi:HD superfamily phosphohydrolase